MDLIQSKGGGERVMQWITRIALTLVIATTFVATSVSAQCVGDCNGDENVRINELIIAVGIALDRQDLSVCPSIDGNSNGRVDIGELISAVGNSLRGCDAPPPTPTATPVPTVRAVCNLSDASDLRIRTGLLDIDLDPAGVVNVDCTSESSGELACECGIESFDPVVISGVGDVCVEPFGPCESRSTTCGGGGGVDVVVEANHNIGECTSTANCAEVCDTHCAGFGDSYFRQASTCEDFCLGGSADGETCGRDEDCPDGSCGGPDGGSDGHICECVCASPGGGSGAAGALACGIGFALTVELDNNQVCGDVPPSITLAPICGEITTGTAMGTLANVANSTQTLGPFSLEGTSTTCEAVSGSSASGMTLVGHLAFFGSSIGDLLVDTTFACE